MNEISKKTLKNMSPSTLKDLAERGIISIVTNQPIPTRAEDTPEFKKHAKLKGSPIHLSAACRKYSVSLSTMSRWVNNGIIPVLGKVKNRTMLDEAYVAYCSEVLKSKGNDARGKWLFDKDRMPYQVTTIRNR